LKKPPPPHIVESLIIDLSHENAPDYPDTVARVATPAAIASPVDRMSKRRPPSRSADPAEPSFSILESPLYWVVRIDHRHVHELNAVLKRIGMDVPRWRVLMILTEFEPASVSLIAEHGVIKLFTMTKTVKRLEREGLVKTRQRASDARVTEVVLTEKGREAVTRVRAQASRIFHQAFDGIDATEMKYLNKVLKRISRNLDRTPGRAR
jgi:MarR family transcriptional regulator, organic hydroperoxide resistance regulator